MKYLRPEHSGIYMKIAYSLLELTYIEITRYIILYGQSSEDDLYTMARTYSFPQNYSVGILLIVSKDTSLHYKSLEAMEQSLYKVAQKRLKKLEERYNITFSLLILEADESNRETILSILGDSYKVIWTTPHIDNFIITRDLSFKTGSTAPHPYYRMIGKPLNEYQIFDVICHTDDFFLEYFQLQNGIIESTHFYLNETCNQFFRTYLCSWVSLTGAVGYSNFAYSDFITQDGKYDEDFMRPFIEIATLVPYLDFVVAITRCDETLPFDDNINSLGVTEDKARSQDIYCQNKFLECIESGLWIHNGTIEVLGKKRAQDLYIQYSNYYLDRNEDFVSFESESKYVPDYNLFCKCLEYLDLKPEEVLTEYTWVKNKGLVYNKFLNIE